MRAANSRLLRINKQTEAVTQIKCYEITFRRRTVHSAVRTAQHYSYSWQWSTYTFECETRNEIDRWTVFNWFDLVIYGLTITFAWPQSKSKSKIKIHYHLPLFPYTHSVIVPANVKCTCCEALSVVICSKIQLRYDSVCFVEEQAFRVRLLSMWSTDFLPLMCLCIRRSHSQRRCLYACVRRSSAVK